MGTGTATDPVAGHGRAPCRYLNPRCGGGAVGCPAELSGLPCWEVNDVPCCRHSDIAQGAEQNDGYTQQE